MRAALASGVLVPEVIHILESGDELGRGFVMRRLEGEALGSRIVRGTTDADGGALLLAIASSLAAIHRTPLEKLDLKESSAILQLDQLRAIYQRAAVARPVLEGTFGWLEERIPAAPRPKLVHGDFRVGNLLINHVRLSAVLDWEAAHLGDPDEDLGWFMMRSWRFSRPDRDAGGIGDRLQFIAHYEEASGRAVDPDRIRFWEALGALRWGVMCLDMIEWFRSGRERTIERALIARRVSEAELNLLDIIAPRSVNA